MKTITVSVPQEKLEAFDRATKVISLIAAAEGCKVSVSSVAVDAVIAYGNAQASRLASLLAAVTVTPQASAPEAAVPAPALAPESEKPTAPEKPKRSRKSKSEPEPQAPAPFVLEALGVPPDEPKS